MKKIKEENEDELIEKRRLEREKRFREYMAKVHMGQRLKKREKDD